MGEFPALDQPSEDDEPPPLCQSSGDDGEVSGEEDELDYELPPPVQSVLFSSDNGPHFSCLASYHAYNRADEAGAMDRACVSLPDLEGALASMKLPA
jgi:hypothetical protein